MTAQKTELAFPATARPVARYVSDTAVCEEALEHGRWIGLYWSATGHVHRENVTPGLPGQDSLKRPVHAFELEIDGQSLHNRWGLAGTSRRPGARPGTEEAVVELKHQIRPVTVKVVTRVDGTPVLARYLEITNTGDKPAALGAVSPWSGVLWNTKTERPNHISNFNPSFEERDGRSKFSLGYLADDEWAKEGSFTWQPLPKEHLRVEQTEHGRTWGSPYYILRNETTGELFFLGLAWGGNFFAEFAYRYGSLLSFRVGPLAPAPLRLIAPGETIISPEVHLGPMHGTFDTAVAAWHRHMRASVIPPRPKGREMYTVAGRVVEEKGDWIRHEVDIAAEMGVEAFMVDAGWYGDDFASWWDHRGDWFEGDWLPAGGIKGLRDYTRSKKMLFGLWHEAEALSKKTRVYQQHPEWTLRTDDKRDCADTLDLANPAAAKYFEESIVNIIKGFGLDFYKLDYNVATGEGRQTVRDGYAEAEIWRHSEVVHRAYDRILKECPDVCLENCAGGGGRNDLGMLSRFHYACRSDWSVPPYSIRCINALSLFIPPESLCYYHNHIQHAHQVGDLDTHLRVTLFLQEVGDLIDVHFAADDLAGQSGPLVAPGLWRRLIKPRQARIMATIKAHTKAPVFYHSCGAVTEFLDDLIEIGVDILNPVQVSAAGMDTAQLKKRFGKRLAFWGGGCDTQKILPYATPAQVREEVRRRIRDLAPGGGFVFNPVHNIQPNVPPENVVALFEAAMESGRYPIGA